MTAIFRPAGPSGAGTWGTAENGAAPAGKGARVLPEPKCDDLPGSRRQSDHHETAETYCGTVAQLCAGWRVIRCKDGLQWILQRTRDALMRAGRAVCERMDPAALAALAALPERIGGAI
jgi:hypothetical protein